MTTDASMPTAPIGSFKQFAPGVPYEVVGPVRMAENGEWRVGITMIKTGEGAEIRLANVLEDPDAE